MTRTRHVSAAMLFAVAASSPALAATYDYPVKPVRLVVTAPPGGGADVVARLIARGLTQRMKQQVVVDNRAGGNGVIGFELVARSAPDGYTMTIVSINFVTIPLLK